MRVTTTDDEDHDDHRVAVVVLGIAILAYAVLQSMVVPVLPVLERTWGTTQAEVSWILTANLLAVAVATPIVGRLGDMLGKRRVLVAVLLLQAVGCGLSAMASSLPLMVAGRAVQGAGGGIMPLSYGLLRDRSAAAGAASQSIGVMSALLSAGAALGVVLAGPIVAHLGVPWLFWLPMALSLGAALAAHVLLGDSAGRAAGRITWCSAGLLSFSMVAALLSISKAPAWGWSSARVLALGATAVACGALWARAELRSPVPLIDLRLLRRRAVWSINLTSLLVGFAQFAGLALAPQFLQSPRGVGIGASVSETSLLMLPHMVVGFVSGAAAGWLGRTVGSRTVVEMGAGVSAAGFMVLGLAPARPLEAAVGLTLTGVGFGAVMTALVNLILDAVPRRQSGEASGTNATMRILGGAAGAAVLSAAVAANVGPTGIPTRGDYTFAFLALSSVLVAAGLSARLIPSSLAIRTVRRPIHASDRVERSAR